MYCYFLDCINSNLLEKDLAKLSESYKYDPKIININCVKLFTCHRIEFYSTFEIPILINRGFHVLNNKKDIYKRFFDINLGLKSKILFENAIVSQINNSLMTYNKNDYSFKILSSAFIDAVEFRIKYNLFAKNHGKFAMDFIDDNYLEKENIIFIGSGSLVQDSIMVATLNFKNVFVSTRSKLKHLKGVSIGTKIIKPNDLPELCCGLSSYSLFIATTNIDNEYSNIINQISSKANCVCIGNVTSVEFELNVAKHIYYIDMYNKEMSKKITESNCFFTSELQRKKILIKF